MQLGRIENEPEAVYFGPSDKPAFGSSAIKLWIDEPDLFYRQHVAKDMPQFEGNAACDIGTAGDELLLQDLDRIVVSKYKTRCAGFYTEADENPDKVVLTPSEAEQVQQIVNAGRSDDDLYALIKAGTAQVVYRIDKGPFYLQARVDLEVQNDAIPERVANALQLQIENIDRCLIDLKTCASHYGRYAFKKQALYSPLRYPVQQALYGLIAEKVLGLEQDRLPFRFAAISKDSAEVKFYDLMEPHENVRRRVTAAIGELAYRMRSDDWHDFKFKTVKVLISEHYLEER